MIFNVIFAGTMYQTALQNFLQCAFGADSGVGTLQHPFYNKVMNVLPVKFSNSYTFESLNCVVCEVVFMTSDLSHLVASVNNESISQTIQKGFIGVATVQVNATRWGGLYNHGVYLLLAHFLTLAQSPGTVEGLDTGQTVDGVSYSTDVGSITITDAGLYNKTSYGIMFIQLSRKMGAGPVQFSY